MNEQYVVLEGDLNRGYYIYGPFASLADAATWSSERDNTYPRVIMELMGPED